MKTNGSMKISRRQLLTSAAAGALVPELAGFGAFSVHSGSTTPPASTTAQAAAMLADMTHRIAVCNTPTLYQPPWDQNRPGAQYSSQGTLAASSFPTTMTLVQDGTVAGGVPTQSFGWVFRPGDIPAGHAPLFKVGGVTWPYSAGLQTYWPDGSLKWAAFALMVPSRFAPAQGASTTVTISDGGFGTWPAPSGRTLSEVYAQGLVVNGLTPTFVSVVNNARTVDLFAKLNGDSNQYYAVKDLDGAAGARWTIKTKMVDGSGTADTQFVVTHRIFAMNNPSGGLGGFRWFGEIRQPFYATGAKRYMVFQPPSNSAPATGLNWQTVGPGGVGTVKTPPPFPFNTVSYFNGASGFTGAVTGDILTVTGSLPPYGLLDSGRGRNRAVDPVKQYLTHHCAVPQTNVLGWAISSTPTGRSLLLLRCVSPSPSVWGRNGNYYVNTRPSSAIWPDTDHLQQSARYWWKRRRSPRRQHAVRAVLNSCSADHHQWRPARSARHL